MNSFARDSRPAEKFERRYRRDPDPWNFAASPYERSRYLATLAALLRPGYRHACEPGCTVHDLLRVHLPLTWVRGERHPGFRIDSWYQP